MTTLCHYARVIQVQALIIPAFVPSREKGLRMPFRTCQPCFIGPSRAWTRLASGLLMSNHRFCTCIFLTRELAIQDTGADVPVLEWCHSSSEIEMK